MRLFRPWNIARYLYPDAIFRIKTPGKLLFLTFDDGPYPESTPRLVQILAKHGINAIFFCSGRQAQIHQDLIEIIKAGGNITGNHGYSHLDGWRTSAREYISDVRKADIPDSSHLFRPPYGHLTFGQYRELKSVYKIFFWDIMPYDFDVSFGAENSLKILKKMIRPGSVIVLHDNPGSLACEILDEFIEFATGKGYRFTVNFLP